MGNDFMFSSPATESIKPKYVTPTISHLAPGERAFESPPDKYHVIKIDAQGNEIEGSDFSISAQGYQRQYSHNPNFKVKKKQQ